MQFVAVAAAGAVGAVLRWRIGLAFTPRSFPWTTLGINLLGSFLLTFVLAGPATNRLADTTTIAITVGLLGSFTTFSTFGHESMTLIRDGRIGVAASYVTASLVGGLACAALGHVFGRTFAG